MSDDFQSYGDLAEEGERYMGELDGWLETFSSGPKKWPDHAIAHKTRRRAWVEKVVEICRRGDRQAAERAAAAKGEE